MANAVLWDPIAGAYDLNGVPVPPVVVKAGANAVVAQAEADMMTSVSQLQAGSITAAQWLATMQDAILNEMAAEVALAHGGFANMTAADWDQAAQLAAKQLDYLDNLATDLVSGRYGSPPGAGFGARVAQYANAGRSAYENEQAAVQAGLSGATEARRLLGAADNCPDCKDWAGFGWMPLSDMLTNYPIGGGQCLNNCHCVLIVR